MKGLMHRLGEFGRPTAGGQGEESEVGFAGLFGVMYSDGWGRELDSRFRRLLRKSLMQASRLHNQQ